MDDDHWLLRERVIEATALVDALRHGAEDALPALVGLHAELAGLVGVLCEDGSGAAEACDAGREAMAAIEEALAARLQPLPQARSAA